MRSKQILTSITAMLLLTVLVISCNNSADTSKAGTDTTKGADTSKMAAPADTTKKVDTTKIDTAGTRPIKTSS